MRRLPTDVAIGSFDEVFLGYDRTEAMAEAQRALTFDLRAAEARCPFDVDVASFVQQVANGNFDAAQATIRAAHPWPEIMGRHCHKFCEWYAPDPGRERPFLSALEWAAGRFGNLERAPFVAGPPSGKSVAVVGSGSGGLACAWELRRQGHAVVLYDTEPVASGILFTGYPSFRMNKETVLREHQPQTWGVDVRLGHTVDAAELQRLTVEHDAVFLAVGRVPVRQLGVEGESLEGVLVGTDLLRATWYGVAPRIGPRVAVIGAGYTAVDVVRLAIRLGASSVEMLYRRGIEEMPLNPGRNRVFVGVMEGEGIRCEFMTSVTRILGTHGRVSGIELVTTEYGSPEPSGRPSVRSVPGTERSMEVDTVILAIGETTDAGWLVEPLRVHINDEGFIAVDLVSRQTANPKIWAGGDVIGSKGNDGAAVDGLWAARAIDAQLRGELAAWRAVASSHQKDMTHEVG